MRSPSRASRSVRLPAALAGAAAIGVLLAGLVYGARAAGGADTMGYLSQAYLWLDGDLHIAIPLAADLPWPHPRESVTPLGYKPGGANTIVPTYSPGLPVLMALSMTIAGPCAPYWLPPVFGALLVWSTFVLLDRTTGNASAAAIGAVLMATSPTLVFNMITPMSDTVAAALWTASFAVLTFGRFWHGGVAGLLAALAVVVRPNLAPALLATLVAAESWRERDSIRFGRRSAAVLLSALPAALFIGAVNQRLYGSPVLSGYGPASSLYSLDYLIVNLRQFSSWLAATEGAVLWPVVLLPFLRTRGRPLIGRLAPLVLFASIVMAAYLFYLPFDAWWYLRFLLPAFPVGFLAAGLGADRLASNRRTSWWPAAVIALLCLGVIVRVMPLTPQIALTRIGEERYPAVADFVDSALPPNAAILSMQHSSSIRFYAARLVLRYDAFAPTRLPFLLEWLQSNGYRPYIVLDEWEEPLFKERFGSGGEVGRLNVRVLAEWKSGGVVRVFDPLEPPSSGPRPFQILPRRGHACRAPHPDWRQEVRRIPGELPGQPR